MTAETPAPATKGSQVWTKYRSILIIGGALVLLIGAAVAGFLYWRNVTLYISTDNALVDSNMTAVASPGMGTLKSWQIQPGVRVHADQVIGFVQPAPNASASSSYKVRVPVDGTVIRVDGKEGQVIGAAQPLAYVADLDNLTITAYIDENNIHRVSVGLPVDVTVDATGSKVFSGTVRAIMPATASEFALIQTTDRTTSNFTKVGQRVEIHIDLGNTTNSGLFPGMSANIRIHLDNDN